MLNDAHSVSFKIRIILVLVIKTCSLLYGLDPHPHTECALQ